MEGLASAICGGRHFISCLDGRFLNRGWRGRDRDLGVGLVHMECLWHFYNARDIYRAWRGAKKGDGVEDIIEDR